jgi:hypothetical protein
MRGLGLRASGLGLLILTACASGGGGPSTVVSLAGQEISIEGDTPMRALRLTLSWDPGLQVTAITAGKDATRMNIMRTDLTDGATTAQVLLSDTRKIHLPSRGVVVHVETQGSGALRVVSAEAAADGGQAAQVVIR